MDRISREILSGFVHGIAAAVLGLLLGLVISEAILLIVEAA